MMKKITLLFFMVFGSLIVYSQGTSVGTAEPFCSGGAQLVFPNVTGQPNLTEVGCLGSIPNSAYYYLTIDQPGDLFFTISQQNNVGTPIDVDFIAWGPFANIGAANAQISLTDCPTCPNNTTNPNFYPYTPDLITDCSFDIAPTETLHILGAQAGQVYVILITNFNGAAGTISIQQTSGLGTTSCEDIPVCGGRFFDSGGETGSYSNNENNTVTIYPSVIGGAVTVDFTAFNLASGDVLTVYNGPNAASPSLGNVSGAPSSFTSTDTSGTLTFVFTSNASGVTAGWQANVTCSTPPVCGSTVSDPGGPNANYGNNQNQTSTYFPALAGDAITATFTQFNTEATYDTLTIFNGPNTSSPILAVISGNLNANLPGPYTSSHPSGALTFVFSSDGSTVRAGYRANLSCAPYTTPVVCGSTFYDAGGPSGNYSNGTNQTTTLLPDNAGTFIVATFTAFNTENTFDFLRVYNGPNATFPLLATLTGNLGTAGPFTSTHSSGALTFVFTSDSSVSYAGWAANITCFDPCDLTITTTVSPVGADECSMDYTQLTATTSATPPNRIAIFTENFDSATLPPPGWATSGPGPADVAWSVSNTANAGGNPREMHLEWISGFRNNTWRLTRSTAVVITGRTGLRLSFRHFLDHYSTAYPHRISLETNVDGAGWVQQYAVNPVTADIGPQLENIDLSALSGTNIRFRFAFEGESFGFFDWYIDSVVITADGPPVTPQITWTPAAGLYTNTALTTPYVLGNSAATVYAAPDGTATYTATDALNCTEIVDVTRNKKEWRGTTNTNWYVASNWFPNAIPTIDDCVVIPATASTLGRSPIADVSNLPIPLPPSIAYAKNVSVRNNGSLIVNANTFLEIEEALNVQPTGDVLIRSTGSLVQNDQSFPPNTNNNTGNIRMERTVPGGVASANYVYWSSPVEGFDVGNINTDPSELKFLWNPTQGGLNGTYVAASGAMTVGRGYIVRGLSTPPSPIPANSAQFLGRPSNGIITVPITRGTYTGVPYTAVGGGTTLATNIDDNWNLVGNPYPSAISANAFIAENTAGTPKIDGTIYLWNHTGLPTGTTTQDPFYGNYVYNYLGSSYVATNGVGSTPNVFFGSIAAGQSFFVQMLDGAGVSNTVNFNNSMRLGSPGNGNFLRTGERHRIWLDLIDSNEDAISTLIGYVTDATNDRDLLFDGHDFNDTSIKIYSLIGEEEMTIQGRALPFEQEDRIPLGIVIPQNATYKIAINSADGLFSDTTQMIYLEDTYLNIIYDLRSNPYEFTSSSGTFNDRFILRYTNETLSTPDEVANFGFTITGLKDYIKVTSGSNPINTIVVYDILGRVLADYKSLNTLEFKIDTANLSMGTLMVKATLENGQQKVKKVIHY